MEHLYNPDRMTEDEIKRTFVARQRVIDELVSLVERQPQGAGVQHVVVVAPRGMGKTTILLMAQFAIRDRGLSSQWQTVRFAEESYGVTSLADFWLQAIRLLSEEVGEPELQTEAEELAREFRKDEELQEAAFALLKDWCRQHGKRLALLVDNFDMILSQINDEQENARLRNILMNDGTIMLIGGATTFFREARAYDQPLYNFFKIIHLDNLNFEEMQDLLRHHAQWNADTNIEEVIRANPTRLKVLEYFTGGNPRLVLMLYRIISSSEVVDVKRGLEQLLDQVTPYYKAKLENLPPQQRKILDHVAKISAETDKGLMPMEIADATRLAPNVVSVQLKRLSEQGYVRSANVRGRSSFYTLSEPLYAIWHQMRFGRNIRQKMQWLVSFLKGWYDATELSSESKLLGKRFHACLKSGQIREARQLLEHNFYVAEAMSEPARTREVNSILANFLELNELEITRLDVVTELPFSPVYERSPEQRIHSLPISIEQEDIPVALASHVRLQRAFALIGDEQYKQAREELDCAIALVDKQGNPSAHLKLLYLCRLHANRVLNDIQQMKHDWRHFLTIDNEGDDWHTAATQVLVQIALHGDIQLTQELIAISGKKHAFLPLTYALDTMVTGNRTELEKLSPELRIIATELVERLGSAQVAA